MSLPADFRWGVTDSSLSVEGAAPAADWSRWERDGRVPVSGDGAGFASDYDDDLHLAAALGFLDVRITVEWARLEPSLGKVDTAALESIREILTAARHAGLRPWATLVHSTLPGWFADDERGFADPSSRGGWWARHVDRTAEALEDLVAGWVPIEDPIGLALRGHLLGIRPPGRSDPETARSEGWADELSGDPQARALEWATALARKPGDAVATTKSFHAGRVAADVESLRFE